MAIVQSVPKISGGGRCHWCNQHAAGVSSVPGLALSTRNTAVTLTELPDTWGQPEMNGDEGAVWTAS